LRSDLRRKEKYNDEGSNGRSREGKKTGGEAARR